MDEENDIQGPDDFREEIEETVKDVKDGMVDPLAPQGQPGFIQPETADMDDMAAAADAEMQAEEPPSSEPRLPEAAEPAAPAAPPPDMQQMAAAADAELPPETTEPPATVSPVEVANVQEPPVTLDQAPPDMEQMAAAADRELPPRSQATQTEQVKQSLQMQRQHQFEMDYGPSEVGQTQMDHFEAESRRLDVDFLWTRLMTQKIIDHTHLMEQQLAMLERER